MRGRVRTAWMIVLAAGAAACTSASGDVRGGELRPEYDAAPPPPVENTAPEFPDAAPTSWRGLYRDFFSKNAPSGCARFAACHNVAGKEGSLVSGFVCADADACWDSMRNGKHPGTKLSLVEAASVANPASAEIFKYIRYLDGTPPQLVPNGGTMPKEPGDFAFSAEAIARMKTWIANGALKD